MIPKHRVNWNWIVDLPFGKGKPLGRNSHGLVNGLIGGWQIVGNGQLMSRYFQLPTSMWGPIGKIEVYGKKYPIQDCRSGVCYDGWLYYIAYAGSPLLPGPDTVQAATRVNGTDAYSNAVVIPLE